jgi:hypothetical protein
MYLVHAFRNCTSLTDVDMSEALKTFDAGAFMNCTALFSIKISPRITVINSDTFCGCTWRRLFLSEGLCTIYKDALKECNKLFDITIPSTLHSVAVDKFEGSPFVLCTLVRRYIDLTEDTFYYVFSTLLNKGVTLDEMRQRFDNLPLHRHCYFCDSSHNEHHFESVKQQVASLSGRPSGGGSW